MRRLVVRLAEPLFGFWFPILFLGPNDSTKSSSGALGREERTLREGGIMHAMVDE